MNFIDLFLKKRFNCLQKKTHQHADCQRSIAERIANGVDVVFVHQNQRVGQRRQAH